jgi:hypothetical protein
MTSPSAPANPTPGDGATSRAFRGPAATNATILALILLLVAVVALPASQAPPPAIAEFSPQAQQQITDAPPEQSSDFGTGAGGAGGSSTGTTTTTSTTAKPVQTTTPDGKPVVDRGAVRRCVGNPPRQTEDPQSPPCVNYFSGDNGGATWKGVTRDEIRIAVPANTGVMNELFAHFNSRYEFYGRKLVAVPINGPSSVDGMVAAAIKADVEKQVFGSTLYGDASGREFVFYDELARRGIVSVNARPSQEDEAHLAKFHPYEWSYLPTFDVMSRNKAEWICKALAGKPPEFAGGGERAAFVRKFGLMRTVAQDGSGPDVEPMKAILKGCGIDIGANQYDFVKYEPTDDQAGIRQAQDFVLKFQAAGVNSIICECHTQAAGFYSSPVATKQGYFPEWLISTYMYVAEDTHVQLNEGQQQAHSFGLGWWDKQLAPEQEPWFWAVKDGDPNHQFSSFFDYYDARWLYNSLRVLADGIQTAGPHLTPETFAQGLRKTNFSNPGAGQAPYYQAGVSLGSKHSFVDDAALVWLSKQQPSVWGNVPGAVCYAKHGVRYHFGQWPSDNAGLFGTECY